MGGQSKVLIVLCMLILVNFVPMLNDVANQNRKILVKTKGLTCLRAGGT